MSSGPLVVPAAAWTLYSHPMSQTRAYPQQGSPADRARQPARVLRRGLTLGMLVGVLAACGSLAPQAPSTTVAASCPAWSAKDYTDARVIRKLRVYTNRATGDSAIEETMLTPKATPLLKTGKILVEYDFGPSSKTQIVAGPGNLDIPLHPAPYRESFLILQGSVVMKLGDGTTRTLLPGDMTTYEDMDATRGHGGLTGPCGYVALDLVP